MMAQPRPLKLPPVFPLQKGLVLWLPMDERSGVKAYDRSGKKNHGTLNLPTWVAGRRGSALSFDGVDDYVDCGADASLKITGAFTILAWVKPTALAADNRVFANFVDATNGYAMMIYANGRFRVYTAQAAATQSSISSVGAVKVGAWNHIAVTRSGVAGRTYRNGVDVTVTFGVHSDPLPSTVHAMVGSDEVSPWRFAGLIDDVRIYNRALTAAEVKRLYESERLNPRW